MQTQSVSVALCTHNGAPFLEEQLGSILGQSLLPVEVVISDDASTDATLEIVERVIEDFRAGHGDAVRFTVLRNESALGVVANFEQAVLACTGELIALCDQDDRWHPDRLAAVVREFDARPDLLLVHSDAVLIDGNGEPLGRTLAGTHVVSTAERAELATGHGFLPLLRRNLVTGATTVFSRNLLQYAVPFPREWVHDEWLAIVAAAMGAIGYLDEALVDYRQHGGNQIGVGERGLRYRVRKLFEPRRERNRRLRSRSEILVERLREIDRVSAEYLGMAEQKLLHERMREALPGRRLRRIVPVLREARSGRYATCGRGRNDIARDLLQPDR